MVLSTLNLERVFSYTYIFSFFFIANKSIEKVCTHVDLHNILSTPSFVLGIVNRPRIYILIRTHIFGLKKLFNRRFLQ